MNKILVISALLFIIPSIGFSQTRKERKTALQYEMAGKRYYQQQKYKEAIVEFEKSLAINKKPTIYYNLAQAYRKTGDYKKALFFYKLFLPEIRNIKKLMNEQQDAYIEAITKRIKEMEIKISKIEKMKKDIAEKERIRIEAKLRAEQERKAKLEAEKREIEKTTQSQNALFNKWWFWTGVGSTVFLIGISSYFGIQAMSSNSDWEKTWDTKYKDETKTYSTYSNIAIGAAFLSAGVTTLFSVLYSRNKSKPENKNKSVAIIPGCAPGYCGIALTFSF